MKVTREQGGRRTRKPIQHPELYGVTTLRYVTEVGLSSRITNALERIKIHTMEELARIPEQKLEASKGIGPHIVVECKKTLRQYGYLSVLNGELPEEET